MKKTIVIATAITLGFLTGCTSLPNGRTNTCINNMRLLEGATEQSALVNNLRNGDSAHRDDISSYIKNGTESLRCPSGGHYTFGVVGSDPECSIHGTLTDATRSKHGKN